MSNNPVNAFLEYVQQKRECTPPQIYFALAGTSHAPIFTATVKTTHVTRGEFKATGTGPAKAIAKQRAFSVLCSLLLPKTQDVPLRPVGNADILKATGPQFSGSRHNFVPTIRSPDPQRITRGDDIATLIRNFQLVADPTSIVLNQPADGALTYELYDAFCVAALDTHIRWTCCSCGVANKHPIADPDRSICILCHNDVRSHIATQLDYIGAGDDNSPYWMPRFGTAAEEIMQQAHRAMQKNDRRRARSAKVQAARQAAKAAAVVTKAVVKAETKAPRKKKAPRQARPKAAATKIVATRAEEPALKQVLKALMLPEAAGDVRFPTGWNALPTTLLKPFKRIPAPFVPDGTTTSNPQELPNTEMMAFITRDPLHAFIYYEPNVQNQKMIYTVKGCAAQNGGHSGPPSSSWRITSNGAVGTTKTFLHTPYALGDATGWNPHGDTFYAFSLGKQPGRYFDMPPGGEISLNVTASGGVGQLTFGLDRWNPDGSIDADIVLDSNLIDNGATVISLVCPTRGKYCTWFRHTSGDPASYDTLDINLMRLAGGNLSATKFAGLWAHLPLPNLPAIIGSMPAIAIRGASMRYGNTDAVLYRGGRITWAQVPPGRHWEEFVYPENGNSPPATNSKYGFGALDSYEDTKSRIADKGSYAWLKPSGDSDWVFKTDWVLDGGILMDAFTPMDRDSGFLAFGITGDQSALNGFFEIKYYCEALTTDTTRPTDTCKLSSLIMLELQVPVANANWESENPFHFATFLNAAKGIANGLANFVVNNKDKIQRTARFVRKMTND
jgi:hypothetical protein